MKDEDRPMKKTVTRVNILNLPAVTTQHLEEFINSRIDKLMSEMEIVTIKSINICRVNEVQQFACITYDKVVDIDDDIEN